MIKIAQRWADISGGPALACWRVVGNSPGNKRVSRLSPFTTGSDPLYSARKQC